MPRLRYLSTARRNLISIFDYIAEQSGSTAIAIAFTGRLRACCQDLAATPGRFGMARPELHPDIRSFPYRGYLILFRYSENTLEVIAIIEGHRDVARWFRTLPGATGKPMTPEEE